MGPEYRELCHDIYIVYGSRIWSSVPWLSVLVLLIQNIEQRVSFASGVSTVYVSRV